MSEALEVLKKKYETLEKVNFERPKPQPKEDQSKEVRQAFEIINQLYKVVTKFEDLIDRMNAITDLNGKIDAIQTTSEATNKKLIEMLNQNETIMKFLAKMSDPLAQIFGAKAGATPPETKPGKEPIEKELDELIDDSIGEQKEEKPEEPKEEAIPQKHSETFKKYSKLIDEKNDSRRLGPIKGLIERYKKRISKEEYQELMDKVNKKLKKIGVARRNSATL